MEAETIRARRYLLGQLSEEERSALEQEYFTVDAALGRVEAVEEDLIEDYLAGALDSVERQQFEREYLATPVHRRRVETVRALTSAAAEPQSRTARADAISPARARASWWNWRLEWAAAAAAVVMLIGAATFMLTRPADRPATPPGAPPAMTEAPAPAAPGDRELPAPLSVVAVSLSPVAVRGSEGNPPVVIPENSDVIVLNLEGERLPIAAARTKVATIGGEEVWEGPVLPDDHLAPGIAARAQVPAATLRPDDYIVTLFTTDAVGTEQDRYRYFLRVRAR